MKPDDDRPLAEKLDYHLNKIWSLCQDQNNWPHLNADQKVELRGAMTKLRLLARAVAEAGATGEVNDALTRAEIISLTGRSKKVRFLK